MVVMNLPQLIALTRAVSLVVGGDTGPVHLAAGAGATSGGVVWAYGSGAQWALVFWR